MGVVIEICVKFPGGPTRMNATDMQRPFPNSNGRNQPPGVFHTHGAPTTTPIASALKTEPSRCSNGQFKPLLGPDGGFTSETSARRFRN
jgi:hypothetical protein